MATLVPQVRLSNDGPVVSRLVWGMMRLVEWGMTRSELRASIDACLELGITTFDHADIYGDGECERLFGHALGENPRLRSEVQVVTKCGIRPVRAKHEVKTYNTRRRYIVESVEGSLRRLRTDRIDLLLIHRPDPLMNADETAAALSELRQAGKIVHAGVSNFHRSQFELLSSRLDFPLVTNQVEVSVIQLEAFRDGTLDMCQQLRICPMVWAPFGGGLLFGEGAGIVGRVRNALEHVAATLGNYSVQDVALLWLLEHPAGMIPVLGTGNVVRLRAAAGCLDIGLSRSQWFSIWNAATGAELP